MASFTLPLFVLALLALPAPVPAQSNALDYLDKADLDRARNPQDLAARHLSRAQRSLRKAEKLQAKAGGGEALAPKAEEEYRRALADLQLAITKDPGLAEAHYLAGRTLALFEEHEKALSSCHQAWSLDASLAGAVVCEACSGLELDRPRRAQDLYAWLKQRERAEAAEVLAAIARWADRHLQHPHAAALKAWVEREMGAG